MARLIDADEFLKNEIKRCGCVPLIGSCTSDNEIFKFILEQQPTVDAVEVVHGEWNICEDDYNDLVYHTCSNCGAEYTTDYGVDLTWKFCPNCGAARCTVASCYHKGRKCKGYTVAKMDGGDKA